jgi:hypothetical protein
MTTPQTKNAREICEQILIDQKLSNVKLGILRSENAVTDKLLARGLELTKAYEELHHKLCRYPGALKAFLEVVLTTAAFWSLEDIAEARKARGELNHINQRIGRLAAEVAHLLTQRDQLHNTSGFRDDTYFHVCDLIKGAGKKNSEFVNRVQERFEQLPAQFSLKYWPTLSDVMLKLSSDAESAIPEASDRLTDVATSALRPSRADFFKTFFVAIKEKSGRPIGPLPSGLMLTDNTLASLVNCALDLDDETVVDAAYVKGVRQRERQASRQ